MYFSETCVRSKPPQPNFVGSGPLDLHRISACSTVTLVVGTIHYGADAVAELCGIAYGAPRN